MTVWIAGPLEQRWASFGRSIRRPVRRLRDGASAGDNPWPSALLHSYTKDGSK